jgi:hypothetical protein
MFSQVTAQYGEGALTIRNVWYATGRIGNLPFRFYDYHREK